MYQNREEFIAKFKQQQKYNTITERENQPRTNPNARWNNLYKLDKRKRSKIEMQKMEKDRINTVKELRECTFTPKLNTNYSSNRTKVNNDNANADSNNNNDNKSSQPYATHLTLFARENAWKQRKINKIETIIQSNLNKEIEECMFTPTINEAKILKQNDFYTNAQGLVVDPESYEQYINRKTKNREREEKNHQREKSLPGTGNIYNNQLKRRHRSSHHLIILNKSNDQMKFQVRLLFNTN